MKTLLISLCTVVCTLAGWQLGSSGRTAHGPAVAASGIPALPSSLENQPAAARRPIDVKATMERFRAEVGKLALKERQAALAALIYPAFQNLPDDEFPAAIRALWAGDPWDDDQGTLLLGLWAERNLPAARDWALQLGPKIENMGRGPADAVFRTWAHRDTPGMLTWLEAQAGGGSNAKAIQDIACRVAPEFAAASDPERGFRLIAAYVPDKSSAEFRMASAELYRCWGAVAPEAAAARALVEPGDTERANAVLAVASWWKDNDAAIAWAGKLPDPLLATQALALIGSRVVQADPVKGMGLLASLPQTQKMQESMRTSVSRWAYIDFHSAIGWVAGLDNATLARSMFAEIGLRKQPGEMERALAALPAEQRAQAEQWWRESKALAPVMRVRP